MTKGVGNSDGVGVEVSIISGVGAGGGVIDGERAGSTEGAGVGERVAIGVGLVTGTGVTIGVGVERGGASNGSREALETTSGAVLILGIGVESVELIGSSKPLRRAITNQSNLPV